MTQNGEEARGRGHRGGGGGHRAAGKANPPRYGEDGVGRSSSSSQQQHGSASVGASGGSFVNGNATHHDHLDEDANHVGEVDYTDGEMGSASSSFSGSSPRSSVGSGGGRRGVSSGGGGAGGSSESGVRNNNTESPGAGAGGHGSKGSGRSDGVQAIPGVSARPAVPFGASALSKTMPNTGRGRPRGLRPRASGAGNSGRQGSREAQVPSYASSLGRQASSGGSASAAAAGGNNALSRRGAPSATFREAEARAAESLAPGVPVDVVVRAAIKIESVMRVLIARGYVRRKLVSEVTAFSLIMERGIEVIKVRDNFYVCLWVCALCFLCFFIPCPPPPHERG